MDQIVIPGSTKDTHQFGRELKWRLHYLSEHPHEVCKQAAPNSLLKLFQDYIRGKKGNPGEFRLILFRCPKKKAAKNNHHWIIIDEGYYTDFFEKALAGFDGDYRLLSTTFMKEFCEFQSEDEEQWLDLFHVHFLRADKVGPDLTFWKEYIIARHPNSNLDFIRRYESDLWEIDQREYPKVGFVPVKPKEVFDHYRTVATSD